MFTLSKKIVERFIAVVADFFCRTAVSAQPTAPVIAKTVALAKKVDVRRPLSCLTTMELMALISENNDRAMLIMSSLWFSRDYLFPASDLDGVGGVCQTLIMKKVTGQRLVDWFDQECAHDPSVLVKRAIAMRRTHITAQKARLEQVEMLAAAERYDDANRVMQLG